MIQSKLKLAFKILLYYLLRLIPTGLIFYYIYAQLPRWCDAYFGVIEAQENLRSFLFKASQNTSSSFSIITSFKEFMLEATLSTKFQTLSVISNLATQLGRLAINLMALIILWKSIKHGLKRYYYQKNNILLTYDISKILLPEIQSLRKEVADLSTLIQQKGR